MVSELAQAIQQICDDKKIPVESVVETIESALAAAYRKDFGNKLQNIKVEFDMQTGDFKVFDVKEVVENDLEEEYERIKEERMNMTDEERAALKEEELDHEPEEGEADVKKFNPKTMIGLNSAKEVKKNVKIGDELVQSLPVEGDFGRMAAQTAKQVIIQKLREVERNTVLEEYQDKVGELLNGTVQRRDGKMTLVDFGNITAIMPLEEGIRSERYESGARFKFYIKSVEQGPKGPKVVVSRTHPEILRKLFKLEVPEIASGSVLIKSIAREAGFRSKIAVTAKDENIDPIGSCVGQRGTRVQTIINELGGEKIDIIEWVEDPAKFIAKALAPANIIRVEVKDNEKGDDSESVKEAVVYVAPDQLSLAIGKEGQNVRLAAKLTGWKIDILEDKFDGDETESEEKSDGGECVEDKKEGVPTKEGGKVKEVEEVIDDGVKKIN